ncbi:hypothetical protein PV04_09833 [Phialophora macrospora]|uniref:Uncharacterized protein n=1 Tax=Phialophora macrospora TaxID=1851006 RepID=A0A0D2FSD5_9EURO|nr:hypothetical protein PV04_09833 [Phialophora macrospora]
MAPTKPLVEDILPNAAWCREEDGALVFKKAFSRLKHGTGPCCLSAAAAVALALNDVCCERGHGMVYTVVRCPTKQMYPDLLYVPEAWTAASQAAWRRMEPITRLDRIASGHGWISPAVVVLPFYFRTDRYVRDAVTFLNGPQPYVVTPQATGGPPLHDGAPASSTTEGALDGLGGVLSTLEALHRDRGCKRRMKFDMFEAWLKALAAEA